MKNVCLSGGCRGADTVFGECAEAAGHKVVHWSFGGHYTKCKATVLRSDALLEADEPLKEAAKLLKRNYPSRYIYTNNLLRRNYYQIKNSERVYAVSSLIEHGIVKGGTGWAVAMGIQKHIPEIYFYDQDAKTWYKHDPMHHTDWGWEQIGMPPEPHGIYTGIGASVLNESGEKAIKDLYT